MARDVLLRVPIKSNIPGLDRPAFCISFPVEENEPIPWFLAASEEDRRRAQDWLTRNDNWRDALLPLLELVFGPGWLEKYSDAE